MSRSGRTTKTLLWWLLVIRAVVVLSLGLAFLTSGKVRPILGNLLASYWLIGAVLTLRWVRANRGARGSRLSTVASVLGVMAAVVVLARHFIRGTVSINSALIIIGAMSLLTGILRLTGAFHDDPASDRPRIPHRTALGIIEIVMGLVFISARDITRPVATAAGFWGLIGGTVMLVDAFAVRKQMMSAVTAPPRGPTPESPG